MKVVGALFVWHEFWLEFVKACIVGTMCDPEPEAEPEPCAKRRRVMSPEPEPEAEDDIDYWVDEWLELLNL